MNTFVYTVSSVHKQVVKHIAEKAAAGQHFTTRSELNQLCKAGGSQPRTDLLTTAILNLIEHGYLHKKNLVEQSTVEFWPTEKLVPGLDVGDRVPDPKSNRSSGYGDLMLSARATRLKVEATPEPTGEEPLTVTKKIEENLVINAADFLKSAPSKSRQIFILRFIENHLDVKTGQIKQALYSQMKPYLVDRDIATLVTNGDLFFHNGYYSLVNLNPPAAVEEKSLMQKSAADQLVAESKNLSPDDLIFVLAMIRRLNQKETVHG